MVGVHYSREGFTEEELSEFLFPPPRVTHTHTHTPTPTHTLKNPLTLPYTNNTDAKLSPHSHTHTLQIHTLQIHILQIHTHTTNTHTTNTQTTHTHIFHRDPYKIG